jgi:hypothetical protein
VPLPQPYDGIGYDLVAGVVDVGPGPDGLGRAVAVLGRGLVYATADGGQTWAAAGRMPLDLTDGAHYAWYVVHGPDGHLWASTVRAGAQYENAFVFRSAEPAEAAFPVADEPASEALGGLGVSVSPNPAGGRVEVAVTLMEAGPVRVVVLDALGREVAVVLNGEAAGTRSVGLDVSGWPAGVYVVRATAGDRVETTRLTVVRR